jgi:hypothetical protein
MNIWLTLPQNGIAGASCDVRAYYFREDQYCRAPGEVALGQGTVPSLSHFKSLTDRGSYSGLNERDILLRRGHLPAKPRPGGSLSQSGTLSIASAGGHKSVPSASQFSFVETTEEG